MQDRPDGSELAEAIADFLRAEVLPALDDPRLAFRTRVAINGLFILSREFALADTTAEAECDLLAQHLRIERPPGSAVVAVRALNETLARRIRTGETPPDLLGLLERLSNLKLAIASPAALDRYVGKEAGA